MSQALGVNVRWMYASVFTLGTVLGTVGGALVVPTAAASLDMPVELVVEAFAVVVIGGLGSMRGALVGALDRGPHARARHPLLRRAGDARDLPRGDHDPHRAARGPLREAGRMRLAARGRGHRGAGRAARSSRTPYYVTLVLPALAYGIALLGFNLLFGYTGLLSFGHALFVAIGAYGAAVLSSKLGVKSFELILLASGAAAVVAAPSPWRCSRCATCASSSASSRSPSGCCSTRSCSSSTTSPAATPASACCARRCSASTSRSSTRPPSSSGPFYYYCLALLVVAGLRRCGASCTRPSACSSPPSARTRARPSTSACACASSASSRS